MRARRLFATGNGQLSQLEVKRMLRTMQLFESVDELISVIRAMDGGTSHGRRCPFFAGASFHGDRAVRNMMRH